MKKLNIFKALIVPTSIAAPLAAMPVTSCAGIKTVKLDWSIIAELNEMMVIDAPETISSKNGTKFKILIKQRYVTMPSVWHFLLKKNGHIVGGKKWLTYDSVEPTENEIEVDWSKINDGDTITVSLSYGLPMWSRHFNDQVDDLHEKGKLPPRPKYMYAGDDAILFGEPVSYGLFNKKTTDLNVYFENTKTSAAYSQSGQYVFGLMLGIDYQRIISRLACYISPETSAAYGCIPMFEIEGNIFTASLMSPNNHLMARAVLDASTGTLTSFFISEYYFRDTISSQSVGYKKTNIRPTYYYDDNLPGKFITGSLPSDKIEGKIDKIVLNTAQSIKITDVQTTDSQAHTGYFILNKPDGTEITRTSAITIDQNEIKTVQIDLDDNAREAIKAADGELSITFTDQ